MVFWETAHTEPDAPPHIVRYAHDWQAAEKIVYSTTLDSVSSPKTRIERTFDDDVRLDLDLVDHRTFATGLTYARYRTR